MISQCQEMQTLIKVLGSEFELEVYGDGMIAWMIKCMAEQADQTVPIEVDPESKIAA
jgi:hypothetical protein